MLVFFLALAYSSSFSISMYVCVCMCVCICVCFKFNDFLLFDKRACEKKRKKENKDHATLIFSVEGGIRLADVILFASTCEDR